MALNLKVPRLVFGEPFLFFWQNWAERNRLEVLFQYW